MGKIPKMAKKIATALIALILSTQCVYAATSLNPETFVFPSPDADNDGYTTDGTRLGTDCDDTNDRIFPGALTASGCSAGQFRRCQAGGTYTSCADLSGLTTTDLVGIATGITSVKWVSPSGAVTAGCGSYANPCDLRCYSHGYGGACATAPAAGDAIILRAGNYTGTYGSSPLRQFYINTKNGTSTNNILFMGAPETTEAVIQGQGTSGTPAVPFELGNSAYWVISNIKIDGGWTSHGGLYLWDATNVRALGVTIQNTNGDAPSNNHAGLYVSSGSHSFLGRSLRIFNNIDTDGTDHQSQNQSQVVFFLSRDPTIEYSKIYSTNASNFSSRLIKIKHALSGFGALFQNNLLANAYGPCVEYSQENTLVLKNLMSGCNSSNGWGGAIRYAELGGAAYFEGEGQISNNTIVNSGFFDYAPSTAYGAIGVSNIIVDKNIIFDNAGSYAADIADGMVTLGHYIGGTNYAAMVASVDTFNNNCYETSVEPFFSKGGSSGSTYTTFATWKASSGYDAASFRETLSEDAFYRATSTNCKNWGYSVATSSFWDLIASIVPFRASSSGTNQASDRVMPAMRPGQTRVQMQPNRASTTQSEVDDNGQTITPYKASN